VGVSLELPLPGQVERAKYKTAKIQSEKTELETINLAVKLQADLEVLYKNILMEKELMQIADEKIGLAEDILADETENYSYGKIDLNDLILEVNKLDDAKFKKILHEVNLKVYLVEWLRLTDSLVKKEEVLKHENK